MCALSADLARRCGLGRHPLHRDEPSGADVDQQGLVSEMERVADDPETVVKKAALSLMRARDMAALDQQSVIRSRITALIRT